jgi:hypothetical protein
MSGDLGSVAALPPDAITVHVGMMKTGTTALQTLFADARDDMAQLGVHYPGERGLAAVAASAWQETLKARWTYTLDDWLDEHFGQVPNEAGAGWFWTRHDAAAVVRRWAEAAGPEHVRVVILDEQDRTLLPGAFERLLGLPAGMLAGRTPATNNRGMTADEAELVRRVNVATEHLDGREYRALIRYGMIRRLVENRQPAADEAKPTLPEWARALASEEGRRLAAEITGAGVGVIGDPDNLVAGTDRLARPASAPPRCPTVPVQAAVEAVVGVAGCAGQRPRRPEAAGPRPTANDSKKAKPTVDQLRTRELAAIVLARARRALRRRVARFLPRRGRG